MTETYTALSAFEQLELQQQVEAAKVFQQALLDQLKVISDVSYEIGIIGQPGSVAWVNQMRKLRGNNV